MPGQELLCGINAESTKETDEAIWDQEFSLEENRGDKDWSLTDCLSGMVMERRRLTEALTTDHHFEQTGMRALMLSLPSLRAETSAAIEICPRLQVGNQTDYMPKSANQRVSATGDIIS